jgi:hypothetical protein
MALPYTRPLRTPSPARRPAAADPPLRNLKVLVAGVERDERGSIEAVVKQAFAHRDPGEAWSVSLVRMGEKWSVGLNGPTEQLRNVSFTAEEHELKAAIGRAIGGAAPTATSAGPPGPAVARGTIEERHVCRHCQQVILVSYEGEADEPKEVAPLACPHCWVVGPVRIGAWAAAGGDYRAEKG